MKIGLLKSKKKGECFLALDIGTEAVKALVFRKENQKYFILAAASQYFKDSGSFDKEKIISKVKEEVIEKSSQKPEHLFLSLPANILRNRINFQSFSRKNPKEVISQKEEKNIHEIVFRETKKEIAKYFAQDSGILPQDIQFIDLEILKIKIDGYQVPGLSGYSGQNLEFRILLSFLPKDYFYNFSKIIKKLGFKSQKIVNPVKNLTGELLVPEGVFLDIGGSVTQIYIIRNGQIDMIDEFEKGGENCSLALSQTLGLPAERARLLKERYSRGDLTEETRRRIQEILMVPVKEWSFDLESKLKAIKGLLPSTFYLFGGGSPLPEVAEVLDEEETDVKFIHPKDFKNILYNTHLINNHQYINAILLCYG